MSFIKRQNFTKCAYRENIVTASTFSILSLGFGSFGEPSLIYSINKIKSSTTLVGSINAEIIGDNIVISKTGNVTEFSINLMVVENNSSIDTYNMGGQWIKVNTLQDSILFDLNSLNNFSFDAGKDISKYVPFIYIKDKRFDLNSTGFTFTYTKQNNIFIVGGDINSADILSILLIRGD